MGVFTYSNKHMSHHAFHKCMKLLGRGEAKSARGVTHVSSPTYMVDDATLKGEAECDINIITMTYSFAALSNI